MPAFYLTLILIISYVVGLVITSFTLLSALICFTFAIPLTKELDQNGLLAKNNPITKRYTVSVALLTVIFCVVSFLVYRFGSSAVQIGFALGFVSVFLRVIVNLKQIGVNQENVSDYIEDTSNTKYFIKVSSSEGTPVEDVLNSIYIKTCIDHMNIVASNIARMEKLSSRAEIKARAGEIFKDALRIEPETQEGKFARAESQKYAAQVTQLVRLPSQRIMTNEEKEMLRNHPSFGFSEEKKKRLAKDLD